MTNTPLPRLTRNRCYYVFKPVRADRLTQTVLRLQNSLRQRQSGVNTSAQFDPVLQQLRALLSVSTEAAKPEAPLQRLQLLQASVGNQLRMVPVADVLHLEAADKYVHVFYHRWL